MSVSLSEERDRIQREVEELERSLSVTHTGLELLSSETDDDGSSDDADEEAGQTAAHLLAQKEKIQSEIQNLESVLGPLSSDCVSDDDGGGSSSGGSELGLSVSVDSCLQINLVYQQVLQETLDQLKTLLTQNQREQNELVSRLSGPIKELPREEPAPSSYQKTTQQYLGHFLKPYLKDKLTGLGPPANQETKERASRMTGCLDDRKLKIKRWESWQKTLLIHAVTRDGLRRLIQPKLFKVDYLTQKLSSAAEADKQQLTQQIDSLEREIDLLREKKEEELLGEQYEDHDWQKISNIDFEGTRDADDIRLFWQNFLHPSINKSRWSPEEVQRLKEISRKHKERDWETIAQELGTGRTAFICLQTYQRFVSDSLKRGTWTPAEDDLLRELVEKMRIGNFIPYTQMSYFMEGRGPGQLIYRWNQVLNPNIKKGPWTKEEDQLLLDAVSRHGEKHWWKIKLEVPGRTDGACRDRYMDCLKAGRKTGGFDEQEQKLLMELVDKHGAGRWAKIAAEIPNRSDAQCMREWRKLTKHRPPQRGPKTKVVAPVRGRIKKILMQLRGVNDNSEEDDDEIVVEYMDSDEEKRRRKKNVVRVENGDGDKEAEEEEYFIPPMQEWIPLGKAKCSTSLSFQPAVLPSAGDAHSQEIVRSTILGKFGHSMIVGPCPRELRWEEQHNRSSMMMVSPKQLQAHMNHLAQTHSNLKSGSSHKKPEASKKKSSGHQAAVQLDYKLRAAVTPWIGNLLIPKGSRLTVVDTLRERGEKTCLSSTDVFLLLLQTMNVDSAGCKDMIERRKNKMPLLTSPPELNSVRMKNRNMVAGIMQRRELQSRDLAKSLLLDVNLQLQLFPKPLQQPHLRLLPAPSVAPPGDMPLQVPTILQPLMPNVVFPQAVLQPCPTKILTAPAPSLTTLPSSPDRPSPAGVTSLTNPSVSPASARASEPIPPSVSSPGIKTSSSSCPPVSPVFENSPSSVSANLHAVSSTSAALDPSPDVHDHTVPKPSSTPNCTQILPDPISKQPPKAPSRGRKRGRREEHQSSCVTGMDDSMGGACTDVVPEGKRTRRPSHKAKALQEANKAKSEAKKRPPAPRKRRSRASCSKEASPLKNQQVHPKPGSQELPGQPTLSLVPQSQDLSLTTSPPRTAKSVPVNHPRQILPHPLPAMSTCPPISLPPNLILQPVSPIPNPGPPSLPCAPPEHTSKQFLPFKSTVTAEPAAPLAQQKEALQFDPSLMFREPQVEVCDWLSGQGGVVVSGLGLTLPFLPPFVSSLSTLSALLRAKSVLTKSCVQLLKQHSEPRYPHTTTPKADTSKTCRKPPPPDLPDSTSDPTSTCKPAPSVGTEPSQEEDGLVLTVRQLVNERFGGNPAYQLLKARFLSCFTLPALLATMQPVAEKAGPCLAEDDEEEEEDEELEKIKDRGKRRRADKSLLLSDQSGAPASLGIARKQHQSGPGEAGPLPSNENPSSPSFR